MTYLDGPRPRLFAHRGSSGTAPENTLEAFAEGVAAGADRLELDVHATADGHIVVFHDEELDRTTDAAGSLHSRTLAELRRVDAGFRFEGPAGDFPFRGRGVRIPTLDEVLDAFPGVPLNIEVKHDDGRTVEAFFDVLDRHGARERVLAAAFDDDIIRRVRRVAPRALTSLSAAEVAMFFGVCLSGTRDGYLVPGMALQVPPTHEDLELVCPVFLDMAHDLGMEVHVWTINDESEMERLLDLGVDGLMTDFPARARAVFERKGLRS
ncbi:MAG TPA: glycerophosphodiester phosphodiesterase [Candidatus Binatia bacterium]